MKTRVDQQPSIMRKQAKTVQPMARSMAQPVSLNTSPTTRYPCPCDGGCPNCLPLQAKLKINRPGDRYEQEAEHLANRVTEQDQQAGSVTPSQLSPVIQRQDDERIDEDEDELLVQAKAKNNPPRLTAIENTLNQQASYGRPLDQPTRAAMEEKFGYDFSSVRIHHSGAADQLNDQLNAYAFAHGSHIYFSSGQYQPANQQGQHLLAHELAHVIQQSGGGQINHIQRFEKKPYTGTAVHNKVEGILEKHNDALITEATIPGATRNSGALLEGGVIKNEAYLTKVGFADLYSSTGNKVPAIKMKIDDTSLEPAYQKRTYHSAKSKKTSPTGRFTHSPTVKASVVSGEFPDNFYVADLKPLWLEGIGGGIDQLQYYQDGMAAFAHQAKADGKVSNGSITGHKLTGLTIPAALDYKQFDTQSSSAGTDSWVVKGKKTRYWLYEMPKAGLYLYFTLPHPYTPGTYKQQVDDVLEKLKPVKKKLKPTAKKMDAGINLKAKSTRPTRRLVSQPKTASTMVQRGGPKKKKDKVNWSQLGRQWEEDRAAWDRTYAKPFIKKYGDDIEDKVKVDKKLNRQESASSQFGKISKGLKAISLWQGKTGKIIGKVRFMLGHSFDKIEAVFSKIKEKMQGMNKKIQGTSPSTGVAIGWKKTLIKLIIKGIKYGFKVVIQELVRMFVQCLNGVMQNAVNKFTEEIREGMDEELKQLQEKFESLKSDFKQKFDDKIAEWKTLIDTMKDVAYWGSIASGLVDTIRAGVQVVSCLSPPALGCLWGLVVNVGISVALDLVVGTEWFEENIIRPQVRKLIKTYAGESFEKLMSKALGTVGLSSCAQGVAACQVASGGSGFPGAYSGTGLTGEALRQHRDGWEKKYEDKFKSDLKEKFTSSSGKTVSDKQLQKLLAALKKCQPCNEQERKKIKKAFQEASDSSGKIVIESAILKVKEQTSESAPATAGVLKEETGMEITPGGTFGVYYKYYLQPSNGVDIRFVPARPSTPPGMIPSPNDPMLMPGVEIRFKMPWEK